MLDIDAIEGEVIARSDSIVAETAVEHRNLRFDPRLTDRGSDRALAMASEVAAAIRSFEEQSRQAVARARHVAGSIAEQLEIADIRTERAEAVVAELCEAVSVYRADLDKARARLIDRDAELTATQDRLRFAEKRAADAEKRAQEANDAIELIAHAIRTQLPGRFTAGAR